MSDTTRTYLREAVHALTMQAQPPTSPRLLAQAAAEALDADGAGLTLMTTLRVPLAASSSEVRRAEQLEVTLGDGPTLEAAASLRPVVASSGTLQQRWPLFLAALLAGTPFRSVVSLPLPEAAAALDLYFLDSQPETALCEPDVQRAVAAVVTPLVLQGQHSALRASNATAVAMQPEGAQARMTVWTAVGMIMSALAADSEDCLALLRGCAFAHGCDLDTLSLRLVSNEITISEVLNAC